MISRRNSRPEISVTPTEEADSKPTIVFQVEQRMLEARSGEPLLMVLLRNGIAWRTSRGEDRPRGPFCNMGICQECVVKVEGRGPARACLTPVREGDIVELPR